MKKFITAILMVAVFLVALCSCNSTPAKTYTCEEMAQSVLQSTQFPDMVKTDESMLSLIMDFSANGITEYSVYQQMMSVDLAELIIVRTEDTETVTSLLEQRKQSLIQQFAAYPEQQKSAEATVVGSKGNVCYLIACKNAADAEKALKSLI